MNNYIPEAMIIAIAIALGSCNVTVELSKISIAIDAARGGVK